MVLINNKALIYANSGNDYVSFIAVASQKPWLSKTKQVKQVRKLWVNTSLYGAGILTYAGRSN